MKNKVDEMYPLVPLNDKELLFYWDCKKELKRFEARQYTLRNGTVVPLDDMSLSMLITVYEYHIWNPRYFMLKDEWLRVIRTELKNKVPELT